jgi:predicted RNA-binding protein with PUA-like domain
MKYWLVKSEADCYSIDDLRRDTKTEWTGIRNYQARNFLKEMKKGDMVLFYHSSGKANGIYGEVKVIRDAEPDPTQFDVKDGHFDPKATKEKPIWFSPQLAFVKKYKEPLLLSDVKRDPHLAEMGLTRRGDRLSVHPVSEKHFEYIQGILKI